MGVRIYPASSSPAYQTRRMMWSARKREDRDRLPPRRPARHLRASLIPPTMDLSAKIPLRPSPPLSSAHSPLFSPILHSLAVRAIRPDHSVPTNQEPPRGPVPNMAPDARISHLGTCPSVHRAVLRPHHRCGLHLLQLTQGSISYPTLSVFLRPNSCRLCMGII